MLTRSAPLRRGTILVAVTLAVLAGLLTTVPLPARPAAALATVTGYCGQRFDDTAEQGRVETPGYPGGGYDFSLAENADVASEGVRTLDAVADDAEVRVGLGAAVANRNDDDPATPAESDCTGEAAAATTLRVLPGSTGLADGTPVRLVLDLDASATLDGGPSHRASDQLSSQQLTLGYAVTDSVGTPLADVSLWLLRDASKDTTPAQPDQYVTVNQTLRVRSASNVGDPTETTTSDTVYPCAGVCDAGPGHTAGETALSYTETGVRELEVVIGDTLHIAGSANVLVQAYGVGTGSFADARVPLHGSLAPAAGFEGLELAWGTAAPPPPLEDTTAPVVAAVTDPVRPETGWWTTPVALAWDVADPESGIAAANCPEGTFGTDTAGTDVTCEVTNGAGLVTIETTTLRVDTTAPLVEVVGIAEGAVYDEGRVPPFTCRTTDATSGVARDATPWTLGLGWQSPGRYRQQALCFDGTDHAGNHASATVTYDVRTPDTTAPVVERAFEPGEATGENGWYRTPVTVDWRVSDPESGIDSSTCNRYLLDQDGRHPVSCVARNGAGLTRSWSEYVFVDQTAPEVTVTGVDADRVYESDQAPTPGCTTTDATAGVATQATVRVNRLVAAETYTQYLAVCDGARDLAGNTTPRVEVSYFVANDATPPEILPIRTDRPWEAMWSREPVTVSWSVSDPETGIRASDCEQGTFADDVRGLPVTCTATNGAYLTMTVTIYLNIDRTPPVVAVNGPQQGALYHTHNVPPASCATTDLQSGISVPASLTVEQIGTTPEGRQVMRAACLDARDHAGNWGGEVVIYQVDPTMPIVTAQVDPYAFPFTWRNAPATVTWTVEDPESGIVSQDCPSGTFETEGLVSVTCRVVNGAGYEYSPTLSLWFDFTAPTVAVGGVTQDGVYTRAERPPVSCRASDALSGLVTRPSPVVTRIGTNEIGDEVWRATCTARDHAGNEATATVTYRVVPPYAFGFRSPVDPKPVVNVVRAGAGVPVDFVLGGDRGLDIFASADPTAKKVACPVGATTDAIERTVTVTESHLSYNPTNRRYTWNWKTAANWRGTCRELTIQLRDGSTHQALFKFTS